MKIETFEVNFSEIPNDSCEEVAYAETDELSLSLVAVRDEDGELGYEYSLHRHQHQVYNWNAPDASKFDDWQICCMLSKALEQERRMEEAGYTDGKAV